MRTTTSSIRNSLTFLALLVTAAACRSDTYSTRRSADLLNRVLRAEERVSFQGEQVLSVWSGGRRTDTVSREFHQGPGRSRIDYISPMEVAGRLVVNDGRVRWEYNPAEHVVVRSQVLRHPVASASVPLTASRVLRSYTLVVTATPEKIAGRPVDRVDFRPHDHDRESKIWWVDRTTNVVLRRDVVDSSGSKRQSSAFRKVDFRHAGDPSLAHFTLPAGVKVIESHGDERTATSLKSARSLLPGWAHIPTTIGAGFEFDSARVVYTKGVQTVQVQYSDGLVGLSLFISAVPTQPEATTGGARQIDLGSTRASLIQPFPPYSVLTWTHGGKTYSLVADVSQKTLVAIARKLL